MTYFMPPAAQRVLVCTIINYNGTVVVTKIMMSLFTNYDIIKNYSTKS
jgi:hypothetical protein